jgi:hypothetical protein
LTLRVNIPILKQVRGKGVIDTLIQKSIDKYLSTPRRTGKHFEVERITKFQKPLSVANSSDEEETMEKPNSLSSAILQPLDNKEFGYLKLSDSDEDAEENVEFIRCVVDQEYLTTSETEEDELFGRLDSDSDQTDRDADDESMEESPQVDVVQIVDE